MPTDQGDDAFAAPAILIVPAAIIHAFDFEPGTTG